MGPKPRSHEVRIRESIEVDDNGCWIWQLAVRKDDGYGTMLIGSRTDGSRRMAPAHRVSYEAFVGPIPEGLDLDHLCRVRVCVNPDHLEPVTRRTNLLRGDTLVAKKAAQTHCIHGHPFDDENTYIAKNGTRKCRECKRRRNREYAARRRER